MPSIKKQKNPVQLRQYRVTVKDREGAEVTYEVDAIALHTVSQGDDSVNAQVFGRPEDVAELAENARDSMTVIRRHAMEHMIHVRRAQLAAASVVPAPKSRSASRRKPAQKKAAPKVEKK